MAVTVRSRSRICHRPSGKRPRERDRLFERHRCAVRLLALSRFLSEHDIFPNAAASTTTGWLCPRQPRTSPTTPGVGTQDVHRGQRPFADPSESKGIQCSRRRSEAVSDMPAVGNPVVEVTLRRNGVASTKREGSAGLDGIDEFRGTNAGRAASTVVATLIGRATEGDVAAAATTRQRRHTGADRRACD